MVTQNQSMIHAIILIIERNQELKEREKKGDRNKKTFNFMHKKLFRCF